MQSTTVRILIRVLAMTTLLAACGGPPPPHPPATGTDDAGYLVEIQSELKATPGIPFPYRCYLGFDPYHHTDQVNGLCDNQPINGNNNGIAVYPCSPTVMIPKGQIELTINTTYGDGFVQTVCARVAVTYHGGNTQKGSAYWSPSWLAANGWLVHLPAGPGYQSMNSRVTIITIPPQTWVAYTDASAMNTGPGNTGGVCSWSDPDYDTCKVLYGDMPATAGQITYYPTAPVNAMTVGTF